MKRLSKKIIASINTLLLGGILSTGIAYSQDNTAEQPKEKRHIHALLMGGGTNDQDEHPSFYNSIKLFHDTLIEKQGIPEETG